MVQEKHRTINKHTNEHLKDQTKNMITTKTTQKNNADDATNKITGDSETGLEAEIWVMTTLRWCRMCGTKGYVRNGFCSGFGCPLNRRLNDSHTRRRNWDGGKRCCVLLVVSPCDMTCKSCPLEARRHILQLMHPPLKNTTKQNKPQHGP